MKVDSSSRDLTKNETERMEGRENFEGGDIGVKSKR